jgi:exopolysaccharide biosynthesis polyprenyl glycosylphosphotransferase
MLSRSYSRRIWRTALLPVIDYSSLLVSCLSLYYIRYNFSNSWFERLIGLNAGIKRIEFTTYLQASMWLCLLVIGVNIFLGLYRIDRKSKGLKTMSELAFGIFVVLLGLISYYFIYEFDTKILPNGVPVSRFILAIGGFLALGLVVLSRFTLFLIERFLLVFGVGKINIAIIGTSNFALDTYLKYRPEANIVIVSPRLNENEFLYLEKALQTGYVHEIYIFTNPEDHESQIYEAQLATLSERYKENLIFSPPGLGQYKPFDFRPLIIRGKVFLELKHSNLDGWKVVLKRILDVVFSGLFISIFSWLYLIIAIAIKLDSKGDIFYRNERIGPNGKIFKVWKFRRFKTEYCTSETDNNGIEFENKLIENQNLKSDDVLYKIENDPRLTRIGAFIERTSLDELPQFFNVFIGNMSLVGPRPHQPREVAKYSTHHFKVLNIQPGITGMAQTNGRSDLSFEQEVEYDSYYVEHWSFWLDIWILIKTPFVIIFKRHKA